MANSKFPRRVEAAGLKLGEEIGQGGQAIVYHAVADNGQEVAIKRLVNLRRRARFMQEVAAMERLAEAGCLCIPPVLGHQADEELAFFWMPYYPQGSLQRQLDAGSIADPLKLCEELVTGLAEIHNHGLSHRDIKPDNVLFSGDHLLLADFGLSREVDNDEERLTASAEQIGARLYIAPEMRDGRNESADHRPADLYSLSKVMWCVLTGESRPFDRETEHFDLSRLPSTVLGRPSLRPIEARMERWMDRYPRRRSEVSAQEMIDAIREVRSPAPPVVTHGADPQLSEALERLATQRRVAIAEGERKAHESETAQRERRLARLDQWLLELTRTAIERTQASTSWEAWCTYGDRGRPFVELYGTDARGTLVPVGGYITLLTGLPIGSPATTPDPQTGRPFYASRFIWGVTVGPASGIPRHFTVQADLGTDELIIFGCAYQLERDPRAFEAGSLPIVRSLAPLLDSSARQVGEIAVVVLEAAVSYVESLITSAESTFDD